MKKKNLILIMARSGTDDPVSRQNLRLVKNKPLIYYIIKTALKSKNTHVVVSTDSEEIKELSLMYGAAVVSRPKKLTLNSTSIKEICFDVINKINNNEIFENCLVLHPKIPLIKLKTISRFFILTKNHPGTFFGISTVSDSKYAYQINDQKNFLKLTPNESKIAILNRIVCFKIKEFMSNDGKFVSPFNGIRLSESENLALTTYHDFGIFEQILSKRKILVRIDSSKTIGMGHVYNMLTILNHFRNDEILIVMNKDLNLGHKKFHENLYDIKLFSSQLELQLIIEKFNPDIIFNDILNTKKNYMKNLMKYNSFVVNFEDLGEGKKYANLVFNPIFNEKKHGYNEFYGGKYACVRDEFRLFKNIKLNKSAKNIAISFGGTDQKNLTGRTIDLIEKNNLKNLKITVILGYGFSHTKQIKNKILNMNKKGFQLNLVEKSDFLAQHVRNVDFSIISNGRTAFEFASMGVPLIAISVNQREKSHTFIEDEQIGIHFYFEKFSFEKNLKNGINHMLEFSNRKKYKNNLKDLSLLTGVERVVSIINDEYDKIKMPYYNE